MIGRAKRAAASGRRPTTGAGLRWSDLSKASGNVLMAPPDVSHKKRRFPIRLILGMSLSGTRTDQYDRRALRLASTAFCSEKTALFWHASEYG